MRSERSAAVALSLVLVVAGAFAWGFALRPPLGVDPSPLARLPDDLDTWQGREVPLEGYVESMLRADFNVQRLYVHPVGAYVWLYVGYYGTERGGRPEHTPRACYRAHGWEILEERDLETGAVGGPRVRELLVAQDDRRELVHFWYRSFRRTGMVGGLDQTWDHVVGRLVSGRADGALVRLSTPIGHEDMIVARTRLLQFASSLEPRLGEHWPIEMAQR